jgi:phosphotransferase system enzyme I (PtsI)
VLHQRIDHLFSAEASVQQVFDEQRQLLLNAHDAYLRERAIDLENVKNRVLDVLCNRQTVNHATLVEQGSIVISSALTPSDVVMFKKFGMTAFVTELSGIASHTAILARSLHIPSVIGVPNIANRMHSGAGIIVDGYAGIVIINPKADTIAKYERRQSDFVKREKKLGKLVKVPSVTSDGRKVHLFANADSTDEIEEARSLGAEGIGLVRTEMQMAELNRLPTEEEQTEWYRAGVRHWQRQILWAAAARTQSRVGVAWAALFVEKQSRVCRASTCYFTSFAASQSAVDVANGDERSRISKSIGND